MAQGKEDGAPLTPQLDADYASGNAAPKRKWAHAGVAIFFLINIIVLYVLHFADSGASKSNAVSGDFKSADLSDASSSAKKGLAVSYGADGKLRVGAGTTAYLEAAKLSDSDKISYIQFAPLGTSKDLYKTNLIAYQQGASPSLSAVVTTVEIDTDAKSLSIASAEDKNTIKGASVKGLATLSDSSAVVLTTVASATGFSTSAYVTPVTISGSSVTVEQSKQKLAANGSATNYVTRLSDKHFASAFYDAYSATSSYYQRVQVGTVGADGISFSESVKFGAANTASAMTTIGQPFKVLKANERFTIPWFSKASFTSGSSNASTPDSGLCLSTFSFEADKITAAADVCNTKYAPSYYVDATKLSDNVLALAFVDANNKYALTVVTVEFSEITYAPTFRSAFVIDEATGAFDFGASFGFYPKPSIKLLSDNRIAVGFFNPSNTGKPSVKVFKYSSDLALTEASPVLPIANADFTLATADSKGYGGITINILPLTSGFAIGYGGSWAGKQYQRVSFVESFGDPVGVITESGSTLSVAMAGTTSVDADLEAGRAYYASTSGKLYTPSSTTSDKFVLVNEDKIVIARSSLVGVAVSGSKLFVSAQSN